MNSKWYTFFKNPHFSTVQKQDWIFSPKLPKTFINFKNHKKLLFRQNMTVRKYTWIVLGCIHIPALWDAYHIPCDLFHIQNTCDKTKLLVRLFVREQKIKIGSVRRIITLNRWEIFMQGQMHQRSLILNHSDERIISPMLFNFMKSRAIQLFESVSLTTIKNMY